MGGCWPPDSPSPFVAACFEFTSVFKMSKRLQATVNQMAMPFISFFRAVALSAFSSVSPSICWLFAARILLCAEAFDKKGSGCTSHCTMDCTYNEPHCQDFRITAGMCCPLSVPSQWSVCLMGAGTASAEASSAATADATASASATATATATANMAHCHQNSVDWMCTKGF